MPDDTGSTVNIEGRPYAPRTPVKLGDGPLGLVLDSLLEGIRDVMVQYLDPAVKLSERRHRGPQCQTCMRPTPTTEAREELTNVGDGPDICWGVCDGA